MSRKSRVILQPRDISILGDLKLSPFDTRQLFSLSQRYEQPFTTDRTLRRRLQQLVQAGFVQDFFYRTEAVGALKYYKLTRVGWHYLTGFGTVLPHASYFRAVAPALQRHTRLLADFFVKTLTSCHLQRVKISQVYRENELVLRIGERSLRLDAAIPFKVKSLKPRNCLFELDCGSEPVNSEKQRESLRQKVQFIFDYEQTCNQTFRHYTLFAGSTKRMVNYLDMVADLNPYSNRSICFAATLDSYLESSDPLRTAVFFDEHHKPTSILPTSQMPLVQLPELEESLHSQLAAV
ncbi:MAG: hypothetical protein AAF394_11810 [Planctomycetota bacterium]